MKGRFVKKIALVTGASSGVGQAIALRLAAEGAALALIGRNLDALRAVAKKCPRSIPYQADLCDDAQLLALPRRVLADFPGLDILVHSAGAFSSAPVAQATLKDFDVLYRTNLRAPFSLTHFFLPTLARRRGQIVFINSTTGLQPSAGISQYSATKHALKALADALREEVNSAGIRVLSLYLGRTATPMQAAIHAVEGKPYHPDELIQSGQVADTLAAALAAGREAEITDIRIRPMRKSGTPRKRK